MPSFLVVPLSSGSFQIATLVPGWFLDVTQRVIPHRLDLREEQFEIVNLGSRAITYLVLGANPAGTCPNLFGLHGAIRQMGLNVLQESRDL
ncbi:MAG: hypothetical protein KJ792_14250 [Actinobacteria bacterium]|nr:hypothetical protein [Actinomycetota bacterium]MCG2803062.1 hypothetical protein [Cellulomonas sp.]